ncbi:MAG: LysR family transcriptional regulator [Methyloligellaceae bacterium]
MDVIEGMRTFAAVAEARSFTAGAESLKVSKALASKYVGQLEERLGIKLLHRNTRNVSLTVVGVTYLDGCRRLLDEFDALETAMRNRQAMLPNRICLLAPTAFRGRLLAPHISNFLANYPDTSVDISFADRATDMLDDGFDLALRIGENADPRLVAYELGSVHIVACASPGYVKAHGRPQQPSEMANHRCILDNTNTPGNHWTFHCDGQAITVPAKGRIRVNCAETTRAFLLAGHGIGLCPEILIREDIRSGRLETLFPDDVTNDRPVYAVYARSRQPAPGINVLIDFLAKVFKLSDNDHKT